MLNRKEFRFLGYGMLGFFVVFMLGAFMAMQGCAQLQGVFQGVDTPEKKFLLAQKEVNNALREYKVALFAQTKEVQAEWHEKYDAPIKALSAALDSWQQLLAGVTLDTGQVQEFMRIKNELVLIGWAYFKKEDK